MFSKPSYFHEETEDFKPFDGGSMKARDSPKRYKNFQYKPMDYPNFVMDRRPGAKLQNNNDNTSNTLNYTKATKKGSYNFHNKSNGNVQPTTNNNTNTNNTSSATIDAANAILTEVPAPKELDVDDEGFTKVRHRGQHKDLKKQRENENFRWVVPNRDEKETK